MLYPRSPQSLRLFACFLALMATARPASGALFSGTQVLPCKDLVSYSFPEPGIRHQALDTFFPRSNIVRPNVGVFYDPADTYTLALATLDVSDHSSRVLELGSGMGLASWLVSSRLIHVHGVDISVESVRFAQTHYKSLNTSFSQFDYMSTGPNELMDVYQGRPLPNVLAANPPYVPCFSQGNCRIQDGQDWRSMYGGPYGDRYHSAIIRHAHSLGFGRLALVMGSYSNPLSTFDELQKFGYRIVAITLTAVPYGSFSRQNSHHISKLEKQGRAYTWTSENGTQGYIIIGLSLMSNDLRKGLHLPEMTRRQFSNLLELASKSKTSNLELVAPGRITEALPIRIVSPSEAK